MKTARGRAIRALFSLCPAIFFALSGAASPCFAVNYDYYWSTGSGNEHLWAPSQGGWWEVVYVVDRGGADHPNPQGHYEWEKTDYLNSAGLFKSYAHFSAFNQTVQPKVFSVSLDGNNPVSLESMTIDNTKNVFNPGHDWTFTGDYSSWGKENIFANQIVIKGGASNSRFTTTFDNIGVSTGSLHISDYNTLLVKNGGSLWASEVVLDSGVLDFRGGTLTFGPITGKNNSSVKITAHGNSANISPGVIFTTSVLFNDTYGPAGPGDDYGLWIDFFDSNITIGDANSPSWVEFLGQAFSRSIKLNITKGSRLSFAGDKSFDSYFTPFLELSGSGTLRLTGDLQNWENIAGNAFTGTYDLNGHKLWLDGRRIGSPQGILGGGELTVNLKDALTLGGSEGFFRALASEDLLLSLNAVAGGKLTIADTGTSTGGSLSFFSGEGEIILSGGKYNYHDSIFNQHHLTLTNHAELTVATPYNSATYEGGFNNNGRLTIAGPATLHGDLVMLMNSHTTNSLVLKSRFTVDGKSLFISPFLGQPIKTTFDYRGGKLITDELALNGILFQADLPHPGFYVMAEYDTNGLTGTFGNAANTITNVSSLVKVNGQTQTGQPTWLVYDDVRSRILLIAGDSQTILFRTNAHGNTWVNNYGGWESIAITESGITPTPAHWNNHHVGITAVFDKAHGTPGQVIIDGGVDAYALVFMDNGWIIKAQDTTSKLVLHTLPLHIGEEAHIVLNSQAPDDPTFATSPRIDAPLVSVNKNYPLYKTGAGTLILGKGFYDPASGDTAPARVVIKDGRLVLENNLALASHTGGSPYYSTVTIDPGATLRLNFQPGNYELFNPISGSGSLEIASGSAVTSSTQQPDFYGTIIVEAGNSTVSNTILRVGRIDALGSGGDIVLRKDGTYSYSSELRLNYNDLSAVFPRRITGEGSVSVETAGHVRLAAGNSYTGGTTVDDGATLSLEGPGTGQTFSAAGSGSITLAANAGLNLLSGGILNNELDGVATSKLTLDANAYTLTDNNIRTDGTNFAGDVGIAEGGALTLSADVAQGGASVTPPFSISGSGGLILDGAGVTFSGLEGAKTTNFLGGTTIMDKTTLELGGSHSDQYGRNGQTAITLLGEGSLLELKKSGDTIFTNPLSGTGTVRLFNNRKYTFSGNNMFFAGVIDVNDNTLAINAQSDIGDARLDLDGGMLDFGNNALIPDNAIRLGDSGGTLSNTNSATLRGYITDADDTTPAVFGNLIKTGTGILTLMNPNSDYQGGTNVNAGTLRLEGGGLTGTSGVTVANSATLSGYGQIAGDTTISGGGKLSVDGQLTFDKALDVTMSPAGGLEFNHGGWLDVGGNLSLYGLSNTNKMLINLDSLGVYVLAKYGTTNLADGTPDLSGNYTLNYNSDDITGDPNYRQELLNYSTRNEILLITLPTGQKVEFWNIDNGGVWNTDGAINWNSTYDPTTGLVETWASDSRIAVFGTSGRTPGEVRVQGPVAASGLFFLTDGWTVSGGAITLLDLDPHDAGKSYAVISGQEGEVVINAPLTGAGIGLHKTGAATLTLNAANAYTGDTLVSAGTMALGNVYAAGSNQTITVESGAFLRLAYDSFATAFPQTVTGTGILEITGNVLLDKKNTHSGGTRIADGELRMTHNDALGSGTLSFSNGLLSLANGLAVNNAVSLDGGINIVTVAGGESATLSGVMTGGGLNKIDMGTLSLTGSNSFTGSLYLDQGKLIAGSDTALGHGTVRMADGTTLGFSGNPTLKNDFSLNGTAFFEAAQTDGGTLDGILYGSGDLTKIGNGILTLGGANTYTGATTVNAGTLKGNITNGTYLTVNAGATYDGANSARAVAMLSGAGAIQNTNGFTIRSGFFNGGIDGTNIGGLTKIGPGTLTLSGNNSFTGGLAIDEGKVVAGSDTALGHGTVRMADGAAFGFSGNRTLGNDFALVGNAFFEATAASSGTLSGGISGSGVLSKIGDGTLTLGGANTYSGGTTVYAGTLKGDITDGTDLTVNAGATYDGANSARAVSTLSGGGAILNTDGFTVRSGFFNGGIDGSNIGGLSKIGTGTFTLGGVNAYDGTTNINAGTLRLEGGGLLGGGDVTATSGATLSGYGQIAGDTTIDSGGKFSVDGQFTFDKNLTVTMNSTGGLEFNHGGWLDVGGNLTLNDLNSTNKMLINLDSLGVYVLAKYGTTNLVDGAPGLSGNYTLKYNGVDITGDTTHYRQELLNYSSRKEILLITLPTGQKVEFWNNDNGGVWNTDGAINWNSTYDPTTGLVETWASDSRIAVFGTSGRTPGEVRVQGPVAASGLFFLTDGWTVSGGAIRLLDLDPHDAGKSYAVISGQEGEVVINAPLTGAGIGLHKSGAATVTLNAANTYTGKTLVSAGTLALGNVNAAGLNPTITVEQGAFLRLAYNDSATALPQTVTGAGILEISGNALLNKANTHTGGTSIVGGILHLTHSGAPGSGTLLFRNGLLSLANGLDVSNDIALDGGINLVTVTGGESATLSGVMAGGGLNKIGAGTLTLSGANDFTGGLYLDQGRVVAGNDTALGHGTVRMANGAILGFSGNPTLKNDFSLNGASLFEATTTDYGTLEGIIYGSGDLLKIGNGTLTLGGVNTYTGLTDVREGTLALSTGGSISGQLALHGGTTFDAGGNDVRLTRLDAHWQANYAGSLNTVGGMMKFYLPADVAPGGAAILNVAGTAEIGGSYVALDLGGRRRTALLPGHVLTLVGTSGGINGTPVNSEATGHLGITRSWRANLWTDQNNLYAGVTHIGASDESKALSEGYLAGTALLNQGADLAAGSGMSEAANASRRAARANADRGYGYAAFGTISGGRSRHNTGSHVDMSSLSLMTGISVGIGGGDTASDLLTLGGFFEYGNGAYDTHNSFANAAVHGDGDMYYIGGGILGRMEFADTGTGRFHAEASGRVGRVRNEYDSSDLRDPHTGVKANYDSSSTYYGLHFGAGYVWNMTERASLDLYGKYFWTHQEGNKVTLANGDPVRFKAVDSQRLRLGGRFTYAPDERVTPYIGAAYEREFDGKAHASTYGYAIDTPSLRGDTGIGEFGLTLTPSTNLPLSFDLGVQGYTGQREGVTGSLQIKFEF